MTHAKGMHGGERAAASAAASPCGMDPMMAARQRYVTSTLAGRRLLDLWIVEDSNDRRISPLTRIKLISLLYLAHGLFMAFHDGKPLVSEKVRAWTYGPIFPELYNETKIYGNDAVLDVPQGQREMISYKVRLTSEETDVIDAVYKSYKYRSDTQLLALNHGVGTPWHDTWDGSEYRDIGNDLIFLYFKNLLECYSSMVKGQKRPMKSRQLSLDIF